MAKIRKKKSVKTNLKKEAVKVILLIYLIGVLLFVFGASRANGSEVPAPAEEWTVSFDFTGLIIGKGLKGKGEGKYLYIRIGKHEPMKDSIETFEFVVHDVGEYTTLKPLAKVDIRIFMRLHKLPEAYTIVDYVILKIYPKKKK